MSATIKPALETNEPEPRPVCLLSPQVQIERVIPLMQSLFGALDHGFCVCKLLHDKDGLARDYQIVACNAAIERLTGFGRDAVLAQPASELIPDDYEWWTSTLADIAASGQARRFERSVESLGRTWDITAVPLAGDLLAILYDDISERQRAEF